MTSDGRIRRRRWTAAEDQVVREQYGSNGASAVGALMDRTADSVHKRASNLGIVKRTEIHHPWTDADLDDVRANYGRERPADIAARLGRTTSSVSQQAKVLGVFTRRALAIQTVNHGYFTSVTMPEQAYILGLLAADGNVGSDKPRIIFGQQAKDVCLVELVRDRLSPNAAMSRRPDGYTTVQVTSRQMVADLAVHGIVPRKSRILAWPDHLGELRRPFLLGYFDGDGSMFVPRRHDGIRYPGWTVCSGSEQFLIDMRDYILAAAGVRLQKIQHRKHADLWQVAVTGMGAYSLGEWLHQDGLGLARKRFPEDVIARYKLT